MKAQINPAQYELVYTQVLDGLLLNHKGLPITNVHFGSRDGIEKPFKTFQHLDEECQRRVEFKKEQLEFAKKERERLFQESLNIVKNTEAVLTKKFSILDKFVTV